MQTRWNIYKIIAKCANIYFQVTFEFPRSLPSSLFTSVKEPVIFFLCFSARVGLLLLFKGLSALVFFVLRHLRVCKEPLFALTKC